MKKIGIVITALLLVTACGSSESDGGQAGGEAVAPSSNKSKVPTIEEAKRFATEAGKRFGAQDFGGSWDQWDKRSQAQVPRDDYIEYARTCDLGGVALKVDDIRQESDTTAIVRFTALGQAQAREMIVEDGEWRFKATQETIDLFTDGVEGAIATATEEGYC